MKKWCCYYKDGTRTWAMNINEAINYHAYNLGLTYIGKY